MSWLPFEGCCCCFSLRTGSQIIAVLSIIGSLLSVLGAGTIMSQRSKIGEDTEATVLLVLSLIMMVLYFVLLVAACVLFYGIHKFRRALFKPWLIITAVLIVLNLLFNILAFAIEGGSTTSVFVSSCINGLISIYFVLCVYSYYLEIKTGESTTNA